LRANFDSGLRSWGAAATTVPNETMSKIYNRPPVILEKGGSDEWLDPESAMSKRLSQWLSRFQTTTSLYARLIREFVIP
jgi:putative SOS response-associated peptidase YedK